MTSSKTQGNTNPDLNLRKAKQTQITLPLCRDAKVYVLQYYQRGITSMNEEKPHKEPSVDLQGDGWGLSMYPFPNMMSVLPFSRGVHRGSENEHGGDRTLIEGNIVGNAVMMQKQGMRKVGSTAVHAYIIELGRKQGKNA